MLSRAAEVAQLVEHLVVAQVAVGSSPIFRPSKFLPVFCDARPAQCSAGVGILGVYTKDRGRGFQGATPRTGA